jgi:Zn-dependent protease with chaperone function
MPQTAFYPPNPQRLPDDLTELNWPYFFRVLVVLMTLILFVAAYLGLLAGSGYLCYASFNALVEPRARPVNRQAGSDRRERDTGYRAPRTHPALAITGLLSSGLLFLFLLKGFFKWRRVEPELQVEITEREQPAFFAFLRRLCQDTGAPMPYRVFLVPEVNAAVTYRSSPLSLLVPTSKNLLVGLGLVNRLNLTELKAVLAHELGHFSQGSMKLGAYVYQANHIIADMVYGRDFFDDLLERMQNTDDRLDLFAKGFKGLIWVLRKGLEGLFKVLNFANSSLSRQMEFNADLVAVSVAGSDAIVHALARLDFASGALEQTLQDLADAGDHQLYTRDLYFHQTRAADYLKQTNRDAKLGEVPPLPDDPTRTTQVFEPGDTGIPLMWASHPSNFDREQNAKRHYVRGVTDERLSWILFDNPAVLRQRITSQYYEHVHQISAEKLIDPEAVQAFIDEEHAETTYPEKYHGVYDGRFLDLTGWDMWLHGGLEMRDPQALQELHAQLYGPPLAGLMEKHRDIQKEHVVLQELAEKGRAFTFRGRQYPAQDAPQLLESVARELDDNHARLGAFDRQVFQVHYAMAELLGGAYAEELKARYAFQASVQDIVHKLEEAAQAVDNAMAELSGERQFSHEYFQQIVHFFQETHLTMSSALASAERLRIPRLKNIVDGQRLSEFLLTEPLVSYLPNYVQALEGTWTDCLCRQLGEMLDRGRRFHLKSLGGILGLQEQITSTWRQLHEAKRPPEPKTVLVSS